ncbi:MAG: ABC transporter substrate-binding protein [Gammaproteobacteria bacterium]|nr:ABC transporter substrate-binding protein [Gammaproteobacteria bacterium]
MRVLYSLFVVLLCAGAQVSRAADAVHPALALVTQTADKIQTQLRAERDVVTKNPKRVYELVEQIVLPNFDFTSMSASVLGKNWRGASDTQKQRFTQEFKLLLVRTYAKALVDNMDRKIATQPLRAADNATDVTVHTEIPQQGGFPLPINYSMEIKDGAWKVYDVDIDGISMVKNYRTTFANEVKQGSVDDLIKKLSERNQQAANE